MNREIIEEELDEIEYDEDYYDQEDSNEHEEILDLDKTEKDSNGQVRFKSVNHSERAVANEVESDGEIATYLNYALEYFNYRCALSGERFVIFDEEVQRGEKKRITTNLSAEHVLALTTGGNDIIPNLVPSVLQYNIQKNGYYILDWWTKAKDINGNPLYSPERLLKLTNYMLKSLEIRKDLGIKKNPREYRKRLLTPNEIDEYLAQEEIAKGLESETITATTDDVDGKKILTQIPQKEGEIPSLVKQKEQEIRITETMFLTDSLEILGREERIPQNVKDKLQAIYTEVKEQIPFELQVRQEIIHGLEKIGIENNKYTVANDLLLNSDLLEQLKNKSDNEIENLVQEYLLAQVEKVQEELTEEQTKIAISNMPELLYNHRAINRVIFWKENRSSNLDELLQQHDATDELIDVLIILKKAGIGLNQIKRKSTISDLIEGKENKEEILEQLQEIQEKIDINWPIGIRLNLQKSKNISKLQEEIEKSELQLTNKERKIITEKENKKDLSQRTTQEFVEVLRVLKESGIGLEQIKVGKSTISDLIEGKENKEEILEQLQEIQEEIDINWLIGMRLDVQKSNNIIQLQEEIEKSGLQLTEEERIKILEVKEQGKGISTQEFVEVLRVLKESGISLNQIKRKSTISDLIEGKENKEEILEQLQAIQEGIDINWLIGQRLTDQKRNNISKLQEEIEKIGLQLTEEERIKILEVREQSKGISTQEFVEVLRVLKESGISLNQIKRKSTISDLIEGKENKEEILEQLQEIQEEIDENWPIGEKLQSQKSNNLSKLQEKIEKLGLQLTEEERIKILEVREQCKGRSTQEFVEVLRVLKESGIGLDKIKIGESTISDLIEGKENKEEILEQLQEIQEKIDINWPIGIRLNLQKSKNISKLQEEIEKSGLQLTDKERIKILEVREQCKGRSTQEFVEVLKVLKESGISLEEINVKISIISDLIEGKENKEEIIERLQEIQEGIDSNWPIGEKLSNQKSSNISKLQEKIEKLGLDLTEEERIKILEVKEQGRRISTQEFVEVLRVLKESGIGLEQIKVGKSTISDLIEGKENKEEILERLQEIQEEIDENWPIGKRLSKQKSNNLSKLQEEIEKSGLELTDKEREKITEKSNASKKTIKKVINDNKDNLLEGIDVGEELEREISEVERKSQRGIEDDK